MRNLRPSKKENVKPSASNSSNIQKSSLNIDNRDKQKESMPKHMLAEFEGIVRTLNMYEEKCEDAVCRLIDLRKETTVRSADLTQQIVDKQLEHLQNAPLNLGLEDINEEAIDQLKTHISNQKQRRNEDGRLAEEIEQAKNQRAEAQERLKRKIAAMKQILADD